jgi:type VI protein secretion system component Hcp
MNFSTSSREKYFTVQLTNAKVAYIANQGSDDYILEEITLHAQSITRSHVLGATSFTDTLTPGP